MDRRKEIKKDLSGERFGYLTVIGCCGTTPRGMTQWLCRCDCGSSHIVARSCLVQGKTKSCGCMKDALTLATRRKNHPPKRKVYGKYICRYNSGLMCQDTSMCDRCSWKPADVKQEPAGATVQADTSRIQKIQRAARHTFSIMACSTVFRRLFQNGIEELRTAGRAEKRIYRRYH